MKTGPTLLGNKRRVQKAEYALILRFPASTHAELVALKTWYQTNLNLAVSVTSLVKIAIDDYLKNERAKIAKVEQGRFHAKVRAQ